MSCKAGRLPLSGRSQDREENVIAVFSLIRRREGISLDAFQRHWLDPHGVLVCAFPRLARYSQNRVISARSPAADALRLDGIAALAYATDADQEAATHSPEMAACDVDSPDFIGAVVRIVAEVQEIVPPPRDSGIPKLMLLIPPQDMEPHARSAFDATVRSLDGVVGHLWNTTLRQRGPRSAMPVLDFPVGAVVELWFESNVVLDRAVGTLRQVSTVTTASFAIDEVRLV
jgi:uncharacterized protein (TIGR02118 family)